MSSGLLPNSISVPSVRYLLAFDLNGLVCSKPASKKCPCILRPCAYEFLKWCHMKANVFIWVSTQKPNARHMVIALFRSFGINQTNQFF